MMYRLAVVSLLLISNGLVAKDAMDSLYSKAANEMDVDLAYYVKIEAHNKEKVELEAKASYLLGYIHEHQKEYGKSAYAYFESQLLYNQIGKEETSAKLDDNIGKVFFKLYNYSAALDHFRTACRKWKNITSDKYLAQSQYNVGITYRYLNQLDSALHYLNLSLDYQKAVENKAFVADIMNEMGIIQWELENYSLAKNYYMYLSDLASCLGDTLLLAKAYNNLGNAYLSSDDPEVAKSYFNKAFDLKENIHSPTIINTINQLAKLSSDQGDHNQAVEYYEMALATNFNSNDLVETYRGLVLCYKAINQIDKALVNAERLNALNMSIEIAQQEAEQDQLYFMGQLALQKIYQTEQIYQHQKAQNNLWTGMLIITLLLVSIGIYFYLQYISSKKEPRKAATVVVRH